MNTRPQICLGEFYEIDVLVSYERIIEGTYNSNRGRRWSIRSREGRKNPLIAPDLPAFCKTRQNSVLKEQEGWHGLCNLLILGS